MRDRWCNWEQWSKWREENPLKRGDVWEVVKDGAIREILIGDVDRDDIEGSYYAEDTDEPLEDSEFMPRFSYNVFSEIEKLKAKYDGLEVRARTEACLSNFWKTNMEFFP